MALPHVGQGRPVGIGVADITHRGGAGRRVTLQFGGQLLEEFVPTGHPHDHRASPRELEGDRPADAR